jgi:hypothetical protein
LIIHSKLNNLFKIGVIVLYIVCLSEGLFAQRKLDTSYSYIAPPRVQKLLTKGKPPKVTLQISGFYDVGLMDLAGNDNTRFSAVDFAEGRGFGTRYGFGTCVTAKISLHKKGSSRLIISASYNRFQSNFIIPESPDGRVGYNVFSGGVGIENNFNPDRRFKPFIGFEIVPSLINGKATIITDSADINLTIKNSFRLGFAATFGFEYAFDNIVGFNLGVKFTHANVFLKESKQSSNPNEIYLNDAKINPEIPYAGWKQFFYSSFFTGVNFYFGMKNKK